MPASANRRTFTAPKNPEEKSIAKLVKISFLLLAAWIPDWHTLGWSGEIRQVKQRAAEAFLQGDYMAALIDYRYLYDKRNVGEEEILLNLAHCYFVQKNTKQATALYQIATRSPKPEVQSLAWQQLGVLAFRNRRYEWAATCFKNALKGHPANEDARFNYELTRKILARKPTKATPPPEPPAPTPPPPPEADWDDSTGTRSPDEANPYAEIGLTNEQAQLLLEAMQDAEKHYLQQRRLPGRKPRATNRPAW